jgi:hypothetical protein
VIFPSEEGVSKTEGGQPEGVKLKIRERKLRSGLNWQGVLRQKA